MNMSTVKEAWFNGYQNSGKMKWMSTMTKSGQRNIRSITELELLVLLA